jgi:hypothetical protein
MERQQYEHEQQQLKLHGTTAATRAAQLATGFLQLQWEQMQQQEGTPDAPTTTNTTPKNITTSRGTITTTAKNY